MTWDKLTELLIELGEQYDVKVHVVKRDGLDTVALHLPPVTWFVSMKFANSLNMGVYEGNDHRLVGTEQIPLAELTPEFMRERVERAACEVLGLALDPDAVPDFFIRLQEQRSRDAGPERFRDIDRGICRKIALHRGRLGATGTNTLPATT